ncbi:DUF4870 domain-containing protein [Halomicronema sp. CCY15110]|uniref:DUF4870 domain-containing protein n=1 Tax=Halomicronema sp. CCY15110 TaxID=2767773 RepID=UPI00194EA127|nr:DUF4870 domain-containing protein [Halomicronema sp. CCY15110]
MNNSALSLYQNGSLAFKQARYPDAIASLEQFCKETTNRQSKQFFQAQMWLIQAYYRDHRDLHAIALCEQLAKSEIPQVRQWASNALQKLMTTADATPSSPPTTRATSGPPPVIAAAASHSYAPPAEPEPPPSPLPADQNPFDSITDTPSPPQDVAGPVDRAGSAGDSRFVYDGASIPQRPRTSSSPATPVRSQPRTPKKPQQKDLTQQVMSAIAHGSISMLASILLYLLFSDSFIANGLGLLRFAVPLIIFLTTQDKVVKDNAREALNYTITCLILFIPLIFGAIALALILALLPPIGLLLGLALGGYLLVLSFYPVVATFVCSTHEDRVFTYPNWLILHLL